MALHLSIDVDRTIIDDDENLIEGVREHLATLRDAVDGQGNPVFRLQLWSSAGMDWALEIATRHALTSFFASYASKPDIAIDDRPQTAHPSLVVGIGEHFTLQHAMAVMTSDLVPEVDHRLDRECQLISVLQHYQARLPWARSEYGPILREGLPFHPIPFFGNLKIAKVVTIGLNPAASEFEPWRKWPEVLTSEDLLLRLVGYFSNVDPRPHPWFADKQEGLRIIGRTYGVTAAHIDASPWPTKAPTTLSRDPAALGVYSGMIQSEMPHLRHLLKLAAAAERVIVLRNQYVPDGLVELVHETLPGTVHICDTGNFPKWIWEHREDFRT